VDSPEGWLRLGKLEWQLAAHLASPGAEANGEILGRLKGVVEKLRTNVQEVSDFEATLAAADAERMRLFR
jgi:hypothetical protein